MLRLTELGSAAALDFVLTNIGELVPLAGNVARYVMRAGPHYSGDAAALGESISRALNDPVVEKSPYLKDVLLNLLAHCSTAESVAPFLHTYDAADAAVRPAIVTAAGHAGAADWIRARTADLSRSDPWVRRALIYASRTLPRAEARSWLRSLDHDTTALEKIVARWALGGRREKVRF